MKRQEYLQTQWTPYPSVPDDLVHFGRVISISPKDLRLFIKISLQQQISEFSTSDLSLIDVLQPGDLIGVDRLEKIYFLAPGKPVAMPVPLKNLRLWQAFNCQIRRFFSEEGFLEVPTPSMVVCPGSEPTLEVFSTVLKKGSQKKTLFLPTSPEVHLKKSLCLGCEKVFEIKSCFRNDEFSPHHQPEFTMLEWYRAYKDLRAIELDIRALFKFLESQFSTEGLCWPHNYRVASVAELFFEYTGFTITPSSPLEDYKKIAEMNHLNVRGASSIDDYFFAIFINKIEPQIPREQLLIVKDYPPFQAAWARLNSAGWADRMEVYFGGIELANGFNELNNPEEQVRRFENDLAQKRALGKMAIPMDPEFMDLLRGGMPPSAGIALGLERLFMVLFGIKDIKETKLFPYQWE